MRILYLHQYFKTPEDGGAIRSYYIAKELVQAGHQVVMLTSHNRPSSHKAIIEGIEVHYLPVYYQNKLSNTNRIAAFLQFLRKAKNQLKQLDSFDLCYATSTPLTVGLLAMHIKNRLKIPYIFEVRDLWPEAPVQLGIIRNNLLISFIKKLERRIYRHASAIIALSPGIEEAVRNVLPSAKVFMVPNMSDCTYFAPASRNQLKEKTDRSEQFVVGYFGAAGLANKLEYLLTIAQSCLAHNLPIHFLIAAEGGKLQALQQQASTLPNVHFKPYGSKEQVRALMNQVDATYTSFADAPILETNSPNKFFDSLAAGKLSIVNKKGWLKELVENNYCGFYADPKKPEDFVKKIKPFLVSEEKLIQYQQNARKLAEDQFSRKALTQKIISIIEKYR